MKARLVGRKWVQAWFDERMCNHMPSLTLGCEGTLLATWCGGMLDWNGDPMGRDCFVWLSRLERGAEAWSTIEGVGTDIRYASHNGCFFKNRRGEILLVFAKFLDTGRNNATWCGGRDKLWFRKSLDGGLTWLPARETNIPLIGHPACDGLLLANGDMLMAITSREVPDRYFGAIRTLRSTDDGETWNLEALLTADDGTNIREPAMTLRPDGSILICTRACPEGMGWGTGVERVIYAYRTVSRDNGKTWSPPRPSGITNNESKIDLASWPDGSVLMAYDRTTNLDWHERSPLWLAASRDEGLTWENLVEIAPAPGNKCQPAMCRGEDGLLHVVYMHRHTAVEHVMIELAP
ncbi:MAG: exo-alpha-sialidase [Planctomycetota bacterium]